MSIIKFNCTCGNNDPSKASDYNGMLGYEAMVCTVCGRYYDHTGEHPADNWSKSYIKASSKSYQTAMFTGEQMRGTGQLNMLDQIESDK